MTNVPKNDYVNVFKPERAPGRHVTVGVHNPEVPYTPSNPLAWGAKGEWGPTKTFEQIGFENQAKQTMSYCGQDGERGGACPCHFPVFSARPPPAPCRPHPRPVHMGGARQPGGQHVPAQRQERRPAAEGGLDPRRAQELVKATWVRRKTGDTLLFASADDEEVVAVIRAARLPPVSAQPPLPVDEQFGLVTAREEHDAGPPRSPRARRLW